MQGYADSGTLNNMVISSIRMLVALHMILRLHHQILMDQEHHLQLHRPLLLHHSHILEGAALDLPPPR